MEEEIREETSRGGKRNKEPVQVEEEEKMRNQGKRIEDKTREEKRSGEKRTVGKRSEGK